MMREKVRETERQRNNYFFTIFCIIWNRALKDDDLDN